MTKTIYISPRQVAVIKESADEVTFYEFFTEVKSFLKGLLEDPMNADISDYLKNHGIAKNDLLNRMLDRGVVKKDEKIDEPNDAEGNMKSMHYLSYSIPKKDFENKIRRLYDYFFKQ